MVAKENDKKKKIFGKHTSKWLATLLSASAIVLPFAAVSIPTKEQKPEAKIDLYDASNICLSEYLQEYETAYDQGTVQNGTEQYEYYMELLETLSEPPEEGSYITYNFDGSEIIFDTVETIDDSLVYSINNKTVKSANQQQVRLNTQQGYITLELDASNNNVVLTNCNDEYYKDEKIITYNKNGSMKIEEDGQTYEFNSDGYLSVSENREEKNIYHDGNIENYDIYAKTHSGIMPLKIVKKDGSYVIYNYGTFLDEERYNKVSWDLLCNEIQYFYDSNNVLKYIDAYRNLKYEDGSKQNIIMKFLANGDTYNYTEYLNENGELTKTYKCETKYKGGQNSVAKEVDGSTRIKKYDYLEFGPESRECVFFKENDIVLIEEKNGIIYEDKKVQDENGNTIGREFYQAYQYQENGKMYYNEEGKKIEFINNNGERIFYNEEEQITRIENETMHISYYNYEQNINKYISNRSDDEIEVESNGRMYKINVGGYAVFYENGNISELYDAQGNYTKYYESGQEWIVYADGKTTRYDEKHNIISTEENSILVEYTETQLIKSIKNNNKDGQTISINDQYGIVYELGENDYINFDENGVLKSVKQGEILKECFIEGNQDWYLIKDTVNKKWTVYHNDEVILETEENPIYGGKIRTNNGPWCVRLKNGTMISIEDGSIVYDSRTQETTQTELQQEDEER